MDYFRQRFAPIRHSQLIRIESDAFSCSSLQSIVIPSSVEILGSSCFSRCESLSSISFESNSRLIRIEPGAFSGCDIRAVIPSTALFVAHNTRPNPFQLSLSDPESCPMFDRWQRLRESGITVDFRRLPSFKNSVLDLSGFEEQSIVGRSDRISTQIYQRWIDRALTVVKTISLRIHWSMPG
jgi:hypothetical protein